MSNVQNAEIVRGTDKVLRVTVLDASGNVVDLAGATIEYDVARKLTSKSAPLISKETGAGAEVTDAPNGVLEVTIDAADTVALGGTFYHECFITDVSGRRARIFEGELRILDTL